MQLSRDDLIGTVQFVLVTVDVEVFQKRASPYRKPATFPFLNSRSLPVSRVCGMSYRENSISNTAATLQQLSSGIGPLSSETLNKHP